MNHRFEHACWAQTDGTSPLEHGHASVACLKTSCRLPISICTVLREMATRSKSARITGTSCRLELTSGGTDRHRVALELWPKFCASSSAQPSIIVILKKRNSRYGPELVASLPTSVCPLAPPHSTSQSVSSSPPAAVGVLGHLLSIVALYPCASPLSHHKCAPLSFADVSRLPHRA